MQTAIFEDLQRKIDEDSTIKDVSNCEHSDTNAYNGQTLRDIVQTLEKQGKMPLKSSS